MIRICTKVLSEMHHQYFHLDHGEIDEAIKIILASQKRSLMHSTLNMEAVCSSEIWASIYKSM
jgi:hypothetical protein